MKANTIKRIGAVILAAAFMVGCGSSSNNNPATTGWWGSPYGAFGSNGVNSGYVGMGAGGNSSEGEAMILISFSSGSGELQVVSPIYCMGNPSLALAQGTYQLTPANGTTSGSFDGSLGQNITFLATGPTQAVVQVPFAEIFSSQPMCGFNGMTGEFNVAQVAGYSCISADIGFTSESSMGSYSCQ